jgi:hypothetical protein
MTKINPQKIDGKWKSGIALDVHTVNSVHLGVNEQGHDIYETAPTLASCSIGSNTRTIRRR